MKIFKQFMAAFIAAALLMTGFNYVPAEAATAPAGMKAVWISFQDIQTYLKGKNQSDFDASFTYMCAKVAQQGCNTVIVHVRSHNDAIYPSAVYPWSTQMLNGVNPGYDPLADMVKIAHASGLKIHAWINPYGYRNGAISGNPALATNANIVAGVQEIVTKYAVDGIHFDDYFPPIGAANINQMIKAVHDTCAASGKVFGIAPQGNIDNNRAAGADIDTWLSTPGYVDYLCPQIYWTDNYGKAGNVAMYSNRLAAWRALDKAGIPMYVGLAAYRTGSALASDPGWAVSTTNLATQASKAYAAGYSGYMIFRFNTLMSASPATAAELANLKAVK